MSDSFDIRIYNVSNGNFVLGKNLSANVSFCVDAGTTCSLKSAGIIAPKVDTFFLTHWHEDHYSLFTLKFSSFKEIIYYLPSMPASTKPSSPTYMSVHISKLFRKKLACCRSQTNLYLRPKSGSCPNKNNFMRYCENAHSAKAAGNDLSVTFYLVHDGLSPINVSLSWGTTHVNRFQIAKQNQANAEYPLFVFPGDAKERNVWYLNSHRFLNDLEVPLYLASHHGSPYSIDYGLHKGCPFGSNTRYIISGCRYDLSSKSPYGVYQVSLYKDHFYFTSAVSQWDCLFITIR